MTYNIRSGNGDIAKTAEQIRSLTPDIVGLQEVDVHWAERSGFTDQAAELGARLGMGVRFAHIYDLPGAKPGDPRREFGVAVLSRFPIVSWENHPLTRLSTQDSSPSPRQMPGFLEADIDVSGAIVRVFDTHLDYRANPAVREQQVRDMLGFIGTGDAPTLLLGDVNAEPGAAELQPLRDRLSDSWTDSSNPGYTYPSDAPRKRIDVVLHSRHFRVRAAHVSPSLVSDHLPVVVDLVMSREPAPQH